MSDFWEKPGKPFAFRDLPADHFPITVEFLAKVSGEVVHVIEVTRPQVVDLPGLREQFGEVAVRITFGNGVVVESR